MKMEWRKGDKADKANKAYTARPNVYLQRRRRRRRRRSHSRKPYGTYMIFDPYLNNTSISITFNCRLIKFIPLRKMVMVAFYIQF